MKGLIPEGQNRHIGGIQHLNDWGFSTCGTVSFFLNKPYLYPAVDMVSPHLIHVTSRLVYAVNIYM